MSQLSCASVRLQASPGTNDRCGGHSPSSESRQSVGLVRARASGTLRSLRTIGTAIAAGNIGSSAKADARVITVSSPRVRDTFVSFERTSRLTTVETQSGVWSLVVCDDRTQGHLRSGHHDSALALDSDAIIPTLHRGARPADRSRWLSIGEQSLGLSQLVLRRSSRTNVDLTGPRSPL